MNASTETKATNPRYFVRAAATDLKPNEPWSSTAWQHAEILDVKIFLPESSTHHPRTLVRLLYDARGLHGIFQVQDQFVRCQRANYQDSVWKDSCVEFFVQPKPDHGYFNFEMNCGGALLNYYITDPTRVPTLDALKSFVKVPAEIGGTVQVRSSLPKIVEPEITEPICWELKFSIPFSLFENFVGPLGKIPGQHWRGNFFKCAEELSHPHWASWSPVDEFNFHLPRCFGTLQFE